MKAVLAGIRVLDFGRYVAGPHCAALLGDFGAEVIRVEKIDGGEDRYIAPVAPTGEGAAFIQCGRNKLGMTLNPTKPDGREIVRRLVATADVVVVNVPYSALPEMGLDYDSLKAIKPDIILTTCSSFGSVGPYADKLGFDGIGQALSGNMYMSGRGDEPMKSYSPYVDYATAVLCALGTVLALHERQKSGMGQIVEGSLLASAMNITNIVLMEQGVLGNNRVPSGNRGQSGAPADAFRTTDGWVLVQSIGQPLFKRWVELMGEPQWLDDPRFKDDPARAENGALVSARMQAWCADQTTAQVLAALEAAKIPAGEILSPQECLDNVHVQGGGFLNHVDFPGLARPAPVVATPIKLSRTPGEFKLRAPTLGEHTDDILRSLDYSDAEIAELRAKRVV